MGVWTIECNKDGRFPQLENKAEIQAVLVTVFGVRPCSNGPESQTGKICQGRMESYVF